jgi:DNA polymerase-1
MANVAIIDGDVVAYLACVRDYYAFKKANAVETEEEFEKNLEDFWMNFQEIMMDIIKVTKADFFLMAVKSSTNFRDWLFPEYKAHRAAKDDTKKNRYVPVLRQRAIDAGIAIEAHDREADDLVRIWAEEAKACGDTYVVCSIDKDLKCIPGKHLLLKHNTIITVSEQYAKRFYYTQLLQGDPTDNIQGIPGIGPKKAEALLEPYETEGEFQAVVIEEYRNYYGSDWRHYLLGNGKLIYLQRNPNDYFNIRGWRQFEPA